jgi:hypothetical protein
MYTATPRGTPAGEQPASDAPTSPIFLPIYLILYLPKLWLTNLIDGGLLTKIVFSFAK